MACSDGLRPLCFSGNDERVTEILFGSTDELNPPNDRNNDSGPPFSNYGILGGFRLKIKNIKNGFLFLDCLQCAPIAYWFMKFVLLVEITSCSRGYPTGEVGCENELEFKKVNIGSKSNGDNRYRFDTQGTYLKSSLYTVLFYFLFW